MLIRIVILFLLFILVMGMVQKFFRPLSGSRGARRSTIDTLRCPTCKRINLTSSPAPCARETCGYR